jgi:hypothetical protein
VGPIKPKNIFLEQRITDQFLSFHQVRFRPRPDAFEHPPSCWTFIGSGARLKIRIIIIKLFNR